MLDFAVPDIVLASEILSLTYSRSTPHHNTSPKSTQTIQFIPSHSTATMGGGGSSNYRSHADQERLRYEREQRARVRRETQRINQERKAHERAEREAWLRGHRVGKEEMKWWNAAWFPLYAWLKERSAWEREVKRRKGQGYHRVDEVVLMDGGK